MNICVLLTRNIIHTIEAVKKDNYKMYDDVRVVIFQDDVSFSMEH